MIEIVLAGFVDDAKTVLSRRFPIRKNLIELSLTNKPCNRSIGGVLRTKPFKDRVRVTIDLG
jgi:hypothetical protein